MQELTHFIGGQHVKGKSGRFADVMNPATGEVQSQVPLASNEELAEAVHDHRGVLLHVGHCKAGQGDAHGFH